jgi:type II secretory pathway pseudopilin PulG
MNRTRGIALLPVLGVIVLLAFVTAAALQLALASKTAAIREAHKFTQASCLNAARDHLLARLRNFGTDPTTLQFDEWIGASSTPDSLHIRTGHVNGAATPTVTVVGASLIAGQKQSVRDVSNMIVPGATLGSKFYKVVVACTDPVAGRVNPDAGEMELEFTIRYGL